MIEAQRAEPRRPRVVLFDVLETLLQLEGLRSRFVDIGRPAYELDIFCARTVRDGMAFTLVGSCPPFAHVARAALLATTGYKIDEEAVRYVLAGFRELPPYPDAEVALADLAKARIPAYAFTQGSTAAACASLDRVGLRTYLRDVFSCEDIQSFRPPRWVYDWACLKVQSAPERTAMIGANSWEVHGAGRAGLITGFVSRLEGGVSELVDTPHVVAGRLDLVVDALLALPR
ncbi:MAG: Haloacid dehalogenase domain protein hydrolase [Pseudonocardia sp.]|jgi:2-haloacid dehalogenase|nr:Haloacid dehalogenase domain protein hydrolase [Pseudonocardia sp.]